LGDILLHSRARSFHQAQRELAEAKLMGFNAELWLIERDSHGSRYAVISRVKRRGRNPKLRLVERLDSGDEALHGVKLPKAFKIVGRWVDCIALNDRKTLIIRGDRLRLLTK
jgi:hypothetical protein